MNNKKEVVFIFLFVIILLSSISLLSAQSNTPQNKTALNITQTSNAELILTKTVYITPALTILFNLIFGIKDQISLQLLIIIMVGWAALLLIIFEIFAFVPFINNMLMRILIAFIVNCLISLSGGLREGVNFLIFLIDWFNFFEKEETTFLGFVVALLIIGIIALGVSKILIIFRKKLEEDKAYAKGTKVAEMNEKAKIESESFEEKD